LFVHTAIPLFNAADYSIDNSFGFNYVPPEEAMAILVEDQNQWQSLRPRLAEIRGDAIALATVQPFDSADVTMDVQDLETSLHQLRAIATRLLEVDFNLQEGTQMHLGLLAYMMARKGRLEPQIDPNHPDVYYFGASQRFSDLDDRIVLLQAHGLIEARFIERINLCPSCRSARLLVRDQCERCGSADLVREPVIHHFPCASQAARSHFSTKHDLLICFKCGQNLQKGDHEISSTILSCCTCGDVSAQSEIGFSCLDCGTQGEGDLLTERTVCAYDVTDAGIAALRPLEVSHKAMTAGQ
jgi:hypothetical protein